MDQAGKVLGTNVRALRERRGISLSELARRSGIAKSIVSQVERGAYNPTIQTVFSLSRALQVPASSLLEDTGGDVVLVRSDELEVLSSNAVDLRLLRRIELSSSLIEVYDQRVRAGETQKSQGHPGLEHVVVIEGRLLVGPPDAPYELGPGDYVCFPGWEPHDYRTVSGPVKSVLMLQYSAIDLPQGNLPHDPATG